MMTINYMIGVKEGKVWLPRAHEIRLRNCADPPSKQLISE